jgi:hypothetical protein
LSPLGSQAYIGGSSGAGQKFGKTGKKAEKGCVARRVTAPRRGREGGSISSHQLKAMYDAVVVEPIPDRLLQLLNRLDDDPEQ